MMAKPQIDILMATCNGERFVRDQVESIQVQTFEDWRLLVSDDCSADGTLGIVRGMAGADPRIEIVSEGVRFGSAKANFMGLLACSDAPYAMFCDQDDVWLPRKVERTLGAIRRLEEERGADLPLLAFCDMKVVDEGLNVVSGSFERHGNFDPTRLAYPQLLAQNVAAGCCMMFNRALARMCARAADPDKMAMHDWWAMLVASAFGGIAYVDEPLSLYRQHGGNEVGASEYDPAKRAGDVGFMVRQYLESAKQAEYFADVYDTELACAQRACSLEFARSSSAKTFAGGGVPSCAERMLEEGRAQVGAAGGVGEAGAAQPGVWGGVVTYNPDIALLKRNIDAISPQVERLVVFDNGSANYKEVTALVGGYSKAVLVGNGENAGMAVALNRIAAAAKLGGARFALLLDQDSVAPAGLAEALAANSGDGIGIVCPAIADRGHVGEVIAGAGSCEVKRPITSGSLVSLDAWYAVGGYDERLFVDWVDNEFCDSLRARGFRLVRVNSVRLSHAMGDQEYAWSAFGRNALDGRGASRNYYRQNYPAWRWRDRARSQAITIQKYGWSRIGLEERYYFLRSTVMRILLLERNKRELLRAVRDGFAAGVRGMTA